METSQQYITENKTSFDGVMIERPSIYNYRNFRNFLQDAYAFLRSKNPSFSESAFIRKAGYGVSSRGYFTLIVNGRRNLSGKKILGFASALKLSKQETEYFEALVCFNQATTVEDKEYYFSKIEKMVKGNETKAYKVLKGQFNLYSKWYLIAIREVISLADFVNDPDWIKARLRNKVTTRQVVDAIVDLKNLGLVVEKDGDLFQANEFISLDDEAANNIVVTNYHKTMMDKTKEYLDSDPYSTRSASSITFTCADGDFHEIREEIAVFREQMINKYGLKNSDKTVALHMGIQLFHLTEPQNK